jgi:hypothetical protein
MQIHGVYVFQRNKFPCVQLILTPLFRNNRKRENTRQSTFFTKSQGQINENLLIFHDKSFAMCQKYFHRLQYLFRSQHLALPRLFYEYGMVNYRYSAFPENAGFVAIMFL